MRSRSQVLKFDWNPSGEDSIDLNSNLQSKMVMFTGSTRLALMKRPPTLNLILEKQMMMKIFSIMIYTFKFTKSEETLLSSPADVILWRETGQQGTPSP